MLRNEFFVFSLFASLLKVLRNSGNNGLAKGRVSLP